MIFKELLGQGKTRITWLHLKLDLLFVYFRPFQTQFDRKIVDFSWIRTRIDRLKGEHADHLTTTTTAPKIDFFQHPKTVSVKYFEICHTFRRSNKSCLGTNLLNFCLCQSYVNLSQKSYYGTVKVHFGVFQLRTEHSVAVNFAKSKQE